MWGFGVTRNKYQELAQGCDRTWSQPCLRLGLTSRLLLMYAVGTEVRKMSKPDKKLSEKLIPKGTEQSITVIVNPVPNIHLNIGKH